MSIIRKMKDILFDEEEFLIESPVQRQEVKKEIVDELPPVVEQIKVPPKEKVSEITKEVPSVFVDFDEDEFENNMPYVPNEPKKVSQSIPARSKPIYTEYERKVKTEKKVDYKRYEETKTTEIKEKRKFKPSLIISPVYGVLNEDYNPEDIKAAIHDTDNLDIDEVRKKAYGDLIELEKTIDEPVTTFYEEKTSVKLKPVYESAEKVKTIDELLQGSVDEEVITSDYLEENDDFGLTEEIELPTKTRSTREKIEVKIEDEEEDTLENDLFDLIDSMYESKEEVI